MSAGYRDELDAAIAAKESLQSQNDELKAQLKQAQDSISQTPEQSMVQESGIQYPTPVTEESERLDRQRRHRMTLLTMAALLAGFAISFVLLTQTRFSPFRLSP